MFPQMRRTKQMLPKNEIIQILQNSTSGVLALTGDDGYPYAVPLSFVYSDSKIYFHCAKEGTKLNAIRRSPKASFCVIAQDTIVPEKYTSYYKSVVAFGTIRILNTDEQMTAPVELLVDKYCPTDDPDRLKAVRDSFPRLSILEMTIEHMTGKEALDLVNQRSEVTE